MSATFSSTLNQVAYLKIPENDEIRRASDALAQASLTAQNRGQLTQALTWLIAKHAAIVTRDLRNGREMELPAPDLLKTGLVFNADGRSLYFLGARESEPDRTDIYVISENAPKPVLVVDAGGLKSAPVVDPAGKVLIYVDPGAESAAASRGTGGGKGWRGGKGRRGGRGRRRRAGQAGGGRGGRTQRRPPSRSSIIATRKVSTVVGARAVAVGGRRNADLHRARRVRSTA